MGFDFRHNKLSWKIFLQDFIKSLVLHLKLSTLHNQLLFNSYLSETRNMSLQSLQF